MSVQYVYTAGQYTEFRGYPFVNGKPTTVNDRATAEALDKRPEFKRYEPPQDVPAVIRRRILTAKRGAP